MNGAGGMNQKRRPIIIKELETRYEKTTAIYNGTMERLRRINGGRPVTDKAAVVMLSQEIESYRARVEDMREQINSMKKEAAEKAASGSGTAAQRNDAESIRDQLVRKGDVFNQIADVIAVPYMMPEKDLNKVIEYVQKYISEFTYRIRMLPPAGTAAPMEDPRTCPFCGGPASLHESSAEFNEDMAWVECNRCGARTRPHFGPPGRAARAVAAWNQRPDPTARAEANEEIIRSLTKEIGTLREIIANRSKDSVSLGLAAEIADTATRNFKRAALQEIEKLQMPIMRSQNPGDQFKFSGMSEAKEAIRELPPDLEE